MRTFCCLLLTFTLTTTLLAADKTDTFKDKVDKALAACKWSPITYGYGNMTEKVLTQSIQMGESFMLKNQLPAGNFAYEYNWGTKGDNPADSSVRQGGALWGISTFYLYHKNPKTALAIEKAYDFFKSHTKTIHNNGLHIIYPGSRGSETGCVALVSLGIIEYLRAGGPKDKNKKREMEKTLDGYLEYLVSQRMADGHFARAYLITPQKKRVERSSQYFDGEALLCLIKAAKYLGKKKYIPQIESSLRACAEKYTFAWMYDGKPDRTKGFYQWGTMSFYEYSQANWKDSELYKKICLFLAHWMIYHHHTLRRRRNTAYAHEGLIHALLIARQKKEKKITSAIETVVHRGLHKLMRWQVGGPLRNLNRHLLDGGADDKRALGGFQNHRKEKGLRIDVTQHQGHAMLLAQKHLFVKK